MHVHGQLAEGAGADCGAGEGAVPEHRGGDVFAALQAGVLAGGEPRDRGCDQRRRPGPALDWHDGAEAGEVDVCALAGAEDPLPRGHGRRGVRLLRRYGEARPALVAEPRAGVALPSAQGAPPHVAPLRGGECEVLEECGEREARRPHLIQESEQPKRYPAACSDLSVVDCEVAVRNIGNLVECLAFAAHLKKEPAIDEEVSLYGVTDVVQDAQLADEECLPLVSLVHLRTKDVHQAGIAEENLIRFGEGLVILGLGCEQGEDLGLVESIEHLESGFVVRGELPPKFRHIGIEGDMLADNH